MKQVVLAMLMGIAAVSVVYAAGQNENTQDSQEPVVWVWYPTESTPEYADSRTAIIEIAEEALGREIEEQLTTDYAIAIQAIVNNNAALSWLGAEGYTQAHARESAVQSLVTHTGPSGTLEDAKYYSMIAMLNENADMYRPDGEWDLDTLEQQRFSFVSNSSTSGFRVPSSILSDHFEVEPDDLLEGGDGQVFSRVMFGGSHQGSLLNILNGRADIGVFCNSCVNEYVDFVQGSYGDPQPGDVVQVKNDAAAPFDQYPGAKLTLMATVPVLNETIVVNRNVLSDAEVEKLLTALTSDETAANERIFAPEDGSVATIFPTGSRFAAVADEWYDPIRVLSGLK